MSSAFVPSALQRLRRVSGRDIPLVLEAAVLFWLARLAIVVFPFRWIRPLLGRAGVESPSALSDDDAPRVQRIGWAVAGVSRVLPSSRGTCLAQAIAAQLMLRRRGIASTVYLGVVRGKDAGLEAHAWVRCGQAIVTGRAGYRRFMVVSTFAPGSKKEAKELLG